MPAASLLLSWLSLGSAPAQAGDSFGNPVLGWSATAPDGWQAVQQDGAWMLGHELEAGLVLVWFAAGARLPQLQAEGQQGLDQQGLHLAPAGGSTAFSVSGGSAFQQDYLGGAADGTILAAHAVAVVGDPGGLVVLGLTTPEQLPNLSARVDAVARTVRFSAPALPQATGDLAALRGALCGYSGGSGYSASQRMTFDGQGGVTWGSAFSAGGSFQDSQGDYAGGWSAVSGDQTQPSDRGVYSVTGSSLHITWGDGQTRDCTASARRADGRFTVLKCSDKVFAVGACW